MSAPTIAAPGAAFTRDTATWYGYLLIGSYIYLLNVQGNVIPFLQAEFSLSYRLVSLHSSAIAVAIASAVQQARHPRHRPANSRGSAAASGSARPPHGLAGTVGEHWQLLPHRRPRRLPASVIRRSSPISMGPAAARLTPSRRLATLAIVGPLSTASSRSASAGGLSSPRRLFAPALVVAFRRLPFPTRLGPPRPARPASHAVLGVWALLVFSARWSSASCSVAGLPNASSASPRRPPRPPRRVHAGMLAGRIALGLAAACQGARSSSPSRSASSVSVLLGVDAPVAALPASSASVSASRRSAHDLAFGVGVKAPATRSARLTLARHRGSAAPVALGTLADQVGLRLAHLTLPALMVAALVSFAVARVLERRAA
jgi:hypothetical protein